ncbi:MAG: single-stranded-DNA-specific exonuclease RecJ [Firmicutes bacterium]|nr:single-stranded-DNA-specific exonuclease RecJ [Bacillota bacterium]
MRNGTAAWSVRESDPEKEAILVDALGLSPAVAKILIGRGVETSQQAAEFFDLTWERLGAPWLLTDMEPAVERLARAIQAVELITIYGDYDVDGMTATTLLIKTIEALGGEANYYIPLRREEGYGLHQEALDEIKTTSNIVVTVDCGINALKEAEFAKENGLDLIITDHHKPKDELPQALAVINPNRIDCPYPFKELAGVGVALKLAYALASSVLGSTKDARALVEQYLDLVALGTVADVVPLRGENRTLVHLGLQDFGRNSIGLQALTAVAGLEERKLSTGNLGFALAPRLNALGRLDDAAIGVKLLLSDTKDEAESLARVLDGANRERRAIEKAITEEALEIVEKELDLDEDWVIVLGSPKWHPGVIGIVASRIVEKYHRPTMLIAFDGDVGKGSGRSIPGFDLHEALADLSHLLERFGGHKMAAGISIHSEQLDGFRKGLNQIAKTRLTDADLVPKLSIDGEVSLSELDHNLIEELESLAPYGVGNPRPVLMVQDVSLERSYLVGKDQDHLKLLVSEHGQTTRKTGSFNAIGFGLGEHLDLIRGAQCVDLAFQPVLNEWNNRVNVELNLKDIRLPQREFAQQFLDHCLREYRAMIPQWGREKWVSGAVSEGNSHDPGQIIDNRDNTQRTKILHDILQTPKAALLYAASPEHVLRFAQKLSGHSLLKGRIGIFSNLLADSYNKALVELLEQGALDAVVTTEMPPKELAGYFPKVIAYHLPLTFEKFLYLRDFTKAELHLMYTSEDLKLVKGLWAMMYPGWDELARLYLYLRNNQAEHRPLNIDNQVLLKAELGLNWVGFCRGVRVLQELDLVAVEGTPQWQKAGSAAVRLLAAPRNKLDLSTSMGYNDCVKHKDTLENYALWALQAPVNELKRQETPAKIVL